MASALVVVAQRNPIYSAFALIVTLCSLSVIFGLLGSPFIAVLQIVVYAGAIMVLFLFVIMLLNVEARRPGRERVDALQAARRRPWRLSWLQVGSVVVRKDLERGCPRAYDASTAAHGRSCSSRRTSSTPSRPRRS